MKKITFLLTVLAVSFLFTSASAKEYPYEWLSLGISESPATIQRVRWRTKTDLPQAVAELTPARPSPDLWNDVTLYQAESEIEDDYGVVRSYHHITFDNLIPDTKYLYRIGDGNERWSEWYEFKTTKTTDDEFSFIYISDVQVGIHDHYPRVIRQAIRSSADASFIMFAGDLTGGASEWEWNAFFQSNSWIFGMLPVVPIPDSHEYTHGKLTTYWDHLFSYPENTPKELSEQGNYFFDYQGCRFLMINTKELLSGSEEYRAQALAWIEEKLATNPHKWCVVQQHRPIYSVAEGRSSEGIYEPLNPLYEKYDVDLVLTGHDHIYARMRGENSPKDSDRLSGPIHVVSIAGSQVYVPEFYTYVERTGSNIQLYQSVTINEHHLEFKAYLATGELYDHFLISKSGDSKSFTDKAAGWPEITDIPTKTWQVYTEEDMTRFRRQREEYLRSKSSK